MKLTLNFSQFLDNWPESRKDQFSYEALKAIFDYYEQYTEDTGEEIEYDPIAICCEWTEYPTALECAKEYGYGELPDENIADSDKQEADAKEWLSDRTILLDTPKSVVIMQF